MQAYSNGELLRMASASDHFVGVNDSENDFSCFQDFDAEYLNEQYIPKDELLLHERLSELSVDAKILNQDSLQTTKQLRSIKDLGQFKGLDYEKECIIIIDQSRFEKLSQITIPEACIDLSNKPDLQGINILKQVTEVWGSELDTPINLTIARTSSDGKNIGSRYSDGYNNKNKKDRCSFALNFVWRYELEPFVWRYELEPYMLN